MKISSPDIRGIEKKKKIREKWREHVNEFVCVHIFSMSSLTSRPSCPTRFKSLVDISNMVKLLILSHITVSVVYPISVMETPFL